VHPWVHTPEERFREYMKYLKDNGFHVIPMRDLLKYLPEKPLKNDPMTRTRYLTIGDEEPFWPKETLLTRENLDFWLPNMAQDHGYSIHEMKLVTSMPTSELERRVAKLAPAEKWKGEKIKVLPYPGGRHPRAGFLQGAIDPTRGTKVSIFTPWEENGYMVLDLPEALFSNLGLTYLAHTHIPTIWNDQNVENVVLMDDDWIRNDDGSLRNVWTLPNGIVFGANVAPGDMRVDLELWLKNGTDVDLTQLRTQICLMLKGSPGFDELNNDKKIFNAPVAAAKALGKDRWVMIGFEKCHRAWGNEKCPCIHAEPTLPDAVKGQRVSAKGSIVFYEGAGIESAMKKLAKEMGAE
jgi:hypothetical protein